MSIEQILIISISVFALRTLIFSIGSSIERNKNNINDTGYTPFVSIIVPARNEENHVSMTVNSLIESEYPVDKYEIIVVNDRSSDKTGEILESLSNKYANLKIVTVTDQMAVNNLRGKPGALQAGIDIANGEIILMTDADCIVNRKWIKSMVSTYQTGEVGLTASLTNTTGNRVFDKIQTVEWLYLVTMASAGIGLGIPLGCYGNNYSVRRKDYDDVGGYSNVKFSVTEDLALLQAVHNNHRQVRYLIDKDSLVETLPCETFGEYLKQRHRWAIGGLDLGWKAVFFVASSASFWFGIFLALFTNHFILLSAIFMIRIMCDFLLIYPSLVKIQKKALSIWVLPSIFFFSFMELLMPFFVLKRTVVWKNQIFR